MSLRDNQVVIQFAKNIPLAAQVVATRHLERYLREYTCQPIEAFREVEEERKVG